ncbi:glycosyltransferase [Rossellomorea sp. FM04394]|uniref:glycosyltransferase n=1 Tax=Rossellomorea sp. FM04394 TaxID=3243076 RepID=UPI0035A61585
MKNKLVFLTYTYPYTPPSEQFIHEELKVLNDYFDEIILVPTSHASYSNDIYEGTFTNVFTERINRRKKFIEVLIYLPLVLFLNPSIYKEVYNLGKNRLLFNKTALKDLFLNYISDHIITRQTLSIIRNNSNKDDRIIIYSYWFSHLVFSALSIKNKLLKRGFNNLGVVSRAHGSSDVFFPKKMNNYKIGLTNIKASLDTLYSISASGKEYLSSLGIPSDKVIVNRLGVKDNGLVANREIGKELKIVSCSYINEIKRIDLLVKSLANITDINVTWTHFGDGPLYNQIKQMCINKLPSNIKVKLMGKKTNSEIISYYKEESPHIFINVSSIEGIPVSIMEAISLGIPIIATDVGGNSEICISGYNGTLIPHDFTTAQLTAQIKSFFSMDAAKYKELCSNSRELFIQKYNKDINFRAFAESLNSKKDS